MNTTMKPKGGTPKIDGKSAMDKGDFNSKGKNTMNKGDSDFNGKNATDNGNSNFKEKNAIDNGDFNFKEKNATGKEDSNLSTGDSNSNRKNTLISHTIAALVLFLSLLSLLLPRKNFSENENRTLAAFPAFSFPSLQDGSYMAALQTYLSDHFPFRDGFMTMRTEVEKGMGKREINGIFLAKDGYLIESYQAPQNQERVAGQIGKLADTLRPDGSTRLYLMLVPTAIHVYQEKLPRYAPSAKQAEAMQALYGELGFSDASEEPDRSTLHPNLWRTDPTALLEAAATGGMDRMGDISTGSTGESAEKNQLYYRTDHHWTTQGAYLAYQRYCQSAGLPARDLSSFHADTVTREFRGTIYSKLDDTLVAPDAITLYTRPEDRLTVHYTDTGEVSDSLYNLEYLAKKDKYSLFLNNLHPFIEIHNDNAESSRVLCVIKDSYANSMIPFLCGHYEDIYVFDTRYYKFGPSSFISSLREQERNEKAIDVLLLYNMNTIDTDLGIGGIF